ncbi:uncharacterized protein [Oscarella lobularis]|uniref:uncharacterized protein isoform X3 n=1 Tax=Oscarella lobularis TaxID=121494 RepID=UPI0033131AE8
MTKSIVLLAAGSTWPTDARAYSEIQSFSSSLRGRSDSARQAAASEQATPVAREPGFPKRRTVPAHTISRLPKKLTPAQVRDNVKRFSQLGSQNVRNFINGVSDEAFNETRSTIGKTRRAIFCKIKRVLYIVDRFAQGKSSFTKANIQNLGGLKKEMSRNQLEKISPDAISELQDARADFDHCERRTVADVKKKQKSPSQLSPSDVGSIGRVCARYGQR